MTTNASLIEYYAKRAREYDRIYEKPERQRDLETLKQLCRQTFDGCHVLEIACGTGYWTHVVAQTATSVLATDINKEVLQIAKSREYLDCLVRFKKKDVFRLDTLNENHFTAGFAAAWWSHLRKSEVKPFLKQLHRVFSIGTLIVFMDNRFVAGSSTAISRTDADGNTHQRRRLNSGETFEILKNFPRRDEVQAVLSDLATDVRWTELEYYWFLTYRTK